MTLQTQHVSKICIRQWDDDYGGEKVILHGTVILERMYDHLTLKTGGWVTATTAKYTNMFLPDGLRVYRKKGVMFLRGLTSGAPDVAIPGTLELYQVEEGEWE